MRAIDPILQIAMQQQLDSACGYEIKLPSYVTAW